jgi:hypothetical protein
LASEKTFIKELRSSFTKCYSQSFSWKTNDRCTIGVPDVMWVAEGKLIVIEAKFYKGDIKHYIKLLHGFLPQQRNFLDRILTAGGYACGVIGTEMAVAYIVHPRLMFSDGHTFKVSELQPIYKFKNIWDVKCLVKEAHNVRQTKFVPNTFK